MHRLYSTTLRITVASLLLGAIVAGAAAAYAFKDEKRYASVVYLSLSPRLDVSGIGADNLKLAATRYEAFLTSSTAIEEVSSETGLPAPLLSSAVKVMVIPQTVTLTVTAKDAVPRQATIIANAFAEAAVARGETDKLVTAELIAPAAMPKFPSGPSKSLFLLAGGVVGVCAAGVAFVVLNAARRRAFG